MDILLLHGAQVTREILNILNELSPTKKTTVRDASRIVDNMLKRNQFTYVGYVDGSPVCMATLVVMDKLTYGGKPIGLVEDVVVTKSHRRHGYGKQLIEFLRKKAAEYGCRKIILYCAASNLGFYQECGFKQTEFLMRQDLP